MSTGYGLSYHAKKSICCSAGDVKHTCAGKESRQCRTSESTWSNDSDIRLTIILQEVRKNLGMFHCLELFRAETKCKSQPLHMKQQYFVQMELLQFKLSNSG